MRATQKTQRRGYPLNTRRSAILHLVRRRLQFGGRRWERPPVRLYHIRTSALLLRFPLLFSSPRSDRLSVRRSGPCVSLKKRTRQREEKERRQEARQRSTPHALRPSVVLPPLFCYVPTQRALQPPLFEAPPVARCPQRQCCARKSGRERGLRRRTCFACTFFPLLPPSPLSLCASVPLCLGHGKAQRFL